MSSIDDLKLGTKDLSDEDLWNFFAHLSVMLKERGLARTKNFVGERGEFLAVRIYNETKGLPKLQATQTSTKGIDAISNNGERYTVKTISSPNTVTGVFQGLGENDGSIPDKIFEYVVIVVIDEHYRPKQVLELSWTQFLQFKRWHTRMRAWNLTLTKELVSQARVIYSASE